MHPFIRTTGTLCLVAALAACSSMTTISSTAPGTKLSLKNTVPVVPSTVKLRDTSFGNYEFKAVSPGGDAFYGILPLQFRGGRLALDIIFFAPATMFNLRSVFAFYEIDAEHGVIRYRKHANDAWMEYHPKAEERERARRFFGQQASNDSEKAI